MAVTVDIPEHGASRVAGLVLSVPHGGTHMPAWCAGALRVPMTALWSDWDSAALYDLPLEVPVPTVRTTWSRFVADPNRTLSSPLHGDFWSTVVPAADPGGGALYQRALTGEELRARIELAHAPYHRALDRAVTRVLQQHDRVLLVDLHTFGMPLGVDVVLGDGRGTTASSETSDRVERAVRGAGFSLARNLRFSGGHIVRRWGGDDRVDAVQLELDQRRYLCVDDVEAGRPQPRRDQAGWQATRTALTTVLQTLIEANP